MSREEIINIVADHLAVQPDVAAAYIFGSAARDGMNARSDADVAVIFTAGAGGKPARFERRLQLEMDLRDIAGQPVQIVLS
ncbi:MAG: nucleotidyltransferase domain-containing protein [Peptococcaceae bacterium]|nr:nucleotidyltransferase domain-containing protein [Peptococcaceae bacterium]